MTAVVAGSVLWLLVALVLMLSALEGPRRLVQSGLAILGAEFVLLIVASASSECAGGPCVGEATITQAPGLVRALVTYAIPAASAAFTIYLIAYGLRRHHGAQG